MPDSAFRREVARKFQTYNGLFLELPFEQVREDGILLPLFARRCADELARGRSPADIVERFFTDHGPSDRTLYETLYSLLQLAERQVVLFDAAEDAAYGAVYAVDDPQSLGTTLARVSESGRTKELVRFLDDYRVRIVLTAHPTQFYPDEVLGIIADLSEAIRHGEVEKVYELLLQMGKTRFRNRRKPSPEEEADSLLWYLEHVFYHTLPEVQSRLDRAVTLENGYSLRPATIELGFWPGGDRDGNPYVTPDTTLSVAAMLRDAILRCYQRDLQELSRRLTFPGVIELMKDTIDRLSITRQPLVPRYGDDEYGPAGCDDLSARGFSSAQELLLRLEEIRSTIEREHQGLFVNRILDLMTRVRIFGFHFATIDLRQDSRIHSALVQEINDGAPPEDPRDVLGSIRKAMRIREHNGDRGLHRYIISNTQGAHNVLDVLRIAEYAGFSGPAFPLDVVPLFETIDDLERAVSVMEELYTDRTYAEHLARRKNHQTIMLGFSDGTKDGGYAAANWRIFRTKAALTAQASRRGVALTFFDGRGGPPARGGGNTHRFYRSLGEDVSSTRIHLTVQGQTISSKFGTREAATHNVEQIVSAGILNDVFPEDIRRLDTDQISILDRLADDSRQAYLDLRNDSFFVPFLEEMTPLRFYGRTTIGSRPARRTGDATDLGTLRAIPFVGAWSQMKMNVPGFYGLGYGLDQAIMRGDEPALRELYRTSLFFRTLLDNSMQSLSKTRYDLTRYIAADGRFGGLWSKIDTEASRTIDLLLRISGRMTLLENEPNMRASIRLREELILPVTVIQQWALQKLRSGDDDRERLEHIVVKSLAASVNASRNSV